MFLLRLYPFHLGSKEKGTDSLVHFAWKLGLQLLPTDGFSIEPLKVKLLAGEQKAT